MLKDFFDYTLIFYEGDYLHDAGVCISFFNKTKPNLLKNRDGKLRGLIGLITFAQRDSRVALMEYIGFFILKSRDNLVLLNMQVLHFMIGEPLGFNAHWWCFDSFRRAKTDEKQGETI